MKYSLKDFITEDIIVEFYLKRGECICDEGAYSRFLVCPHFEEEAYGCLCEECCGEYFRNLLDILNNNGDMIVEEEED